MSQAEQVVAVAFANLYPAASIQKLTIHAAGESDRTEVQVAQRSGTRNDLMIRDLNPHGSRHVLLNERDAFVYEVFAWIDKKERRLPNTRVDAALPGSAIQLEDLVPRRALDYMCESAGEEEIGGHVAHVIDLRPKQGVPSSYECLRGWFDTASPLLLRSRFYRGGDVVQELAIDPASAKEFSGHLLPTRATISAAGATRLVQVSDVDIRDSLRDRIFMPSQLSRRPSHDRKP